MARKARLVAPGIPHHATQRGNNRQNVFLSDDDRRFYLDTLRDKCALHGVSLLGYCLLSNHVHLIAVPQRPDSLAQALGRTHGAYAQRFNRLHRASGHLWQNRFFSCALGPSHLLSALAYVDLNPVRARLAERAEDYAWSSARTHLNGLDADPLLDSWLWSELGLAGQPYDPSAGSKKFGAELGDATQSGLPLGDAAFIDRMERRFTRTLRRQPPGPKPKTLAAQA
jgi:REP-associated tyrosine transposase